MDRSAGAARGRPPAELRGALGDDGARAPRRAAAPGRAPAGICQALAGVDVIALPTTAITAPRYTEEDEKTAFSDPAALDGLVRHTFLANLTGNPAGTAPVGLDPGGLPIGLQIVGDAWDEVMVLSVLAHLERTGVAMVRRPPGSIELFGV